VLLDFQNDALTIVFFNIQSIEDFRKTVIFGEVDVNYGADNLRYFTNIGHIIGTKIIINQFLQRMVLYTHILECKNKLYLVKSKTLIDNNLIFFLSAPPMSYPGDFKKLFLFVFSSSLLLLFEDLYIL